MLKPVERAQTYINRLIEKRMHEIGGLKMIGINSADVAPVVHGRWIIDSAGGKIACSDCRCIYLGYNGGLPPNYCPNCGAKLDGGTD